MRPHPDIDELRSYFTQLKSSSRLVDVTVLHDRIYNTCARNFLNGVYDSIFLEIIQYHNNEVSKWRMENIENLNDPAQQKQLDEERKQLDFLPYYTFQITKIVNFLNDQPRRRWLIEEDRWHKEQEKLHSKREVIDSVNTRS